AAWGVAWPDLRPRVSQRARAVEGEGARRRMGIDTEVAEPLELHAQTWSRRGKTRLDAALAQHLERSRIEVVEKRLAGRDALRILDVEQSIVEPHLRGPRVRGRHPVQPCLRTPAVRPVAASRRRLLAAL